MSLAGALGTLAVLFILVFVGAVDYTRRRVMLHHPDLWQQYKGRRMGADWNVTRLILFGDLSAIADAKLWFAVVAGRASFWLFFPAMFWAKSLGL